MLRLVQCLHDGIDHPLDLLVGCKRVQLLASKDVTLKRVYSADVPFPEELRGIESRQMGRALFGIWIGLTGCGAVSCAKPEQPETVLDCSFEPLQRDILRVRPGTGIAQDLSFTPARSGTVAVTDNSYMVKIPDPLTKWELRFSINRFTGEAERQLYNDEGKPDFGKGSQSFVICKPYRGKPL